MNDKFGYELKRLDSKLKNAENWEKVIAEYQTKIMICFSEKWAPIVPSSSESIFIQSSQSSKSRGICQVVWWYLARYCIFNNDIFSVKTGTGSKIVLFDELSQYISDSSQRDNFCKALVNQLVNSAWDIFEPKVWFLFHDLWISY